jgi:hypothetical protein
MIAYVKHAQLQPTRRVRVPCVSGSAGSVLQRARALLHGVAWQPKAAKIVPSRRNGVPGGRAGGGGVAGAAPRVGGASPRRSAGAGSTGLAFAGRRASPAAACARAGRCRRVPRVDAGLAGAPRGPGGPSAAPEAQTRDRRADISLSRPPVAAQGPRPRAAAAQAGRRRGARAARRHGRLRARPGRWKRCL